MDDDPIDLQLDRAHSARMYDYYLGGKTNFIADREAVGQIMAVVPTVLVAARASREFMHRSTRFLARSGVRQFLDIGTGIPTSPNLHEIAQAEASDARIIYFDNDPIVLAHAQALLHSHEAGRTAYAPADLTDPDSVLDAPQLRETLDLSRPVALSLNAVLHFVPDDRGAYAIVERFKDTLAPGSALVIAHGTGDFQPRLNAGAAVYRSSGTPVQLRTRDEFARFFTGWDLVEPGISVSHRWRPDDSGQLSDITDAEASCYVAVALKP
jgi:hypothetical protein